MTEEVKTGAMNEGEQVKNTPELSDDAKENKGMAILAYIGILFLIPLLAAKESKFAMYHANQGLILFIGWVAVSIIGGVIPIIGWLLILPLGYLFLFILAVMGIANAAGGKEKPLPLVGKYKILN